MGTQAPVTTVDDDRRREVWLRRCATCRQDDLDAAFGQPALIPEDRWRCPGCAGRAWEAVRAAFPAGPAGRCPFSAGR